MRDRTGAHRERLDSHVFVCTNDRDGEYACCGDADGEAVVEAIKSWLRDRDAFWTSVSVGTTTCLGLCSEAGTAITIQPRNRWYAEVSPEEVPELLEREFGPEAARVGESGVVASDGGTSADADASDETA